METERPAAGSDASPSRRAYNCVQTHGRDEAANAAASAGPGGGRPALSRRPSPDPLNAEPRARVALAIGKGPRGLAIAPMPDRRSYEDDPGGPQRARPIVLTHLLTPARTRSRDSAALPRTKIGRARAPHAFHEQRHAAALVLTRNTPLSMTSEPHSKDAARRAAVYTCGHRQSSREHRPRRAAFSERPHGVSPGQRAAENRRREEGMWSRDLSTKRRSAVLCRTQSGRSSGRRPDDALLRARVVLLERA